MPRKNAPEFTWCKDRQQYRKRLKDPVTGKWNINVYADTKAELRAKVELRQAELAAAAAPRCPYFYEYAAKWYQLNTADLSEKRRSDYRVAINNHISPVIGHRQLDDIKPDDIKAVMASVAGMSKSAQQKIVTSLKRIFAAAEENGLIDRTPCTGLKAGGKKPDEKVPLTKEQQAALLKAVEGTSVEMFVYVCLYAGLRREEAVGLCWDAVHLDAEPPYIEVTRAVRWTPNKPEISGYLKSDAARRKIPCPPPLVSRLRALRAVRDTSCKRLRESPYVICNQDGGMITFNSFRRMWDAIRVRSVRDGYALGDKVRNNKIQISLNFHVTPHQLRHTYITELITAGANIKTVQYLAGHATVQLTLNIYAHVLANKPADTMGAVALAFGDQNGDQSNIPKRL